MSEYIKTSIKKNKPHFLKYKKYINENDWTILKFNGVGKPKSDVEVRKSEFEVQNQLALAILNRLKLFVKKAEGDHHLKIFKDFTKEALNIIQTHTERADDYISVSNIADIKDVDLRASEIEFHNFLYTTVSKIDDTIASLNIKDDNSQGDGIEFWDDRKAPLSMHKKIVAAYPEVKRRLDAMGIDFESEPDNELLLYKENVPEYNPDKHFWEQDKSTLQFYVDEYKKLHNGIYIDGLYISGWQYYHMNIFTTQYPVEKINKITGEVTSDNLIGVPPFRDNEFWVMENFEKARKDDKMLFLAATRRAAKTTMLASRLGYASTIGKLNLICAGGSTKDLDQIESNFKIDSQNKNPAFRIPNINDNWEKKVELGLKKKDGKNIISSVLHVINLNKGGEKSSEILAGYTPDEVIIDEIMKLPFIDQLAALKPALDSPYGKRCTVILSGTAGNEELAKDAFAVLSDPDANDILQMDWEALESRVALEDRTWVKRPFGTFIPAQMSAKQGLIKIDTNFKDFLKIDNAPNLEKIKIKVTDWGYAKIKINEDRKKVEKDTKLFTKEVLYFPIDPEEMLKTTKVNPFPREEAVRRKQYLIETGEWDRRREVFINDRGRLEASISTMPLAPFPHRGGNIDAPLLIFQDIPDEKPVDNLFVATFDDVKQDNSDTDSLIYFSIWKMNTFGDEWGGRLVLSWACRPADRKPMYKKWLLLQQAYNAKAFPENEDMGYKSFLETMHLEDIWLIPSVDFTSNLGIANNEKRKYGWMPKRDKKVLFGNFVDKMDDMVVIGEDDEGNPLEVKGVQQVNDIGLLDEMIDYKEGMNVDRISGSLGAVGWMRYLEKNYMLPKQKKEQSEERPRHFQKKLLGASGKRRTLG
jgi:hypothetical protein